MVKADIDSWPQLVLVFSDAQVAENSGRIVKGFNASGRLPLKTVFKPVVKTPDEIRSAFSSAVTVEHLEDFTSIAGIEMIRIGQGPRFTELKNELRWNDIAYHLLQGVRR